MRFTVHRPGNPVASPRNHGVPRRDVLSRVHISIAHKTAGSAPEHGLTLAPVPVHLSARRAPEGRSLHAAIPMRMRYLWIVAVAVIVGLLAPVAQARAQGADAPGDGGVQPYNGLSQAQRANLLSIARDTWKFYNVDIDSGDQPADGQPHLRRRLGHPHHVRPVHLGGQHRGVPVGGGLGPGPGPDQRARRRRPGLQATLTEVSHLQRYDGFLYQWYDTTNGDVLTNPGQADCPAGAAPGVQQLLLRLQRGQRLVRLGPHRGPGGHAGAGRAWRTA